MAGPTSFGARVLVVDDDRVVRRSLAQALASHGHEVLVAESVHAALELVAEHTFACAVVDGQLHQHSGLPVLRALRESQPDCVRILVTGRRSGDVYMEAVREGGVMDIVRKPFSIADLLSTMDRNLRDRQRVREQDPQILEDRRNLEQALGPTLSMALQPIVDDQRAGPVHGRHVVAYEALLRSRHLVLDTPPALLSVAERLDRVVDVGSKALALAAERLAWIEPHAKLFVNLHPVQLAERRQLEEDLAAFADHTDRVVFEITERTPLDDVVFTLRTVDMIRSRGFAIAVDDLGAGYSSLAMVADVEPQYIKLDMSLVRDLHRQPRRQRLVQLLQRFGEAEQTIIIAEGVETTDELDALRQCHVRWMQGYLFARPSLERPVPALT